MLVLLFFGIFGFSASFVFQHLLFFGIFGLSACKYVGNLCMSAIPYFGLFGYQGFSVCWFDLLVFGMLGLSVCLVFRYFGISVFRYFGISVSRYVGILVCWYVCR